ncbi:MAG: T9SS type A sorting domain-containing protein, partial [Bacteroidetes bacterium]|nr:T9SS type A sorting domain-containing protein [Bacteroidota bacterium]
DIYFPTMNVGYAVGYYNFIRTIDGGNTWTYFNPFLSESYSVYFTDANTGYLGGKNGNYGYIIKIVNGGATWSISASTYGSYPMSIQFTNANTGYSSWNQGYVQKTTNAGANWTTIYSGFFGRIFFSDMNTGYLVGGSGYEARIAKTTDAGNTWALMSVGPTNAQLANVLYDASFPDNNTGYAVGNWEPSIMKMLPLPIITLTSPVLNSILQVGSQQTISWNAQNDNPYYKVKLEYSTNDGASWQTIINETTNSGYYNWTVPCTMSAYCNVRITGSGYPGIADTSQRFSIQNNIVINFNEPISGQVFPIGFKKRINWAVTNPTIYNPQTYKLEYSTNGGSTWTNITSVPASQTVGYLWTVPNIPSVNCKIRVSDNAYPSCIYKVSDVFAIASVSVPNKNIKFYDNVTPNNTNPQNFIQTGKRVRLKIQAQNNYSQNLLTLKGRIRTTSPYITVTDSMGTFNNILQGQYAWSFDEYEIELSNEFPPDGQVEFIFTMKDEIVTTTTWVSNFWIPFPLLSRVFINDDSFFDSQGNNNSIAESSETIEIVPIVKNNSFFGFSGVTGQLVTSEPTVTIWNNHAGSTQTVMDAYAYANFTAMSDNYIPQWDYVFEKSAGNNSPVFQLVLNTLANSINAKYCLPFTLNMGVPPAGNNQLIQATDSASFSRIEFYQNVVANPDNPQNLIGPGRKVRFKLQATNTTNKNLFALNGKISATIPGVVITDSLASFNNVSAGVKGWSVDEFEIVVPNTLPANGEIKFTLTLKDPFIENGIWFSAFKIPFLQFTMVVIDDDEFPDSDGDNDDIAEPGETIEIIPLINNLTTTTFFTTIGHLTTPVDYLSIWNNHQGASGLVYDTYPYNVFNNISVPIAPNSNNVMPEQDFVFDHNGAGIYTLDFNMIISSFMNAAQGVTWDVGGIRMKYAIPFILNQGQPSPLITVISPNGGESWQQGSTHTITWSDNIIENVKIDLYKAGLFSQQITLSTPSTGTFSWTIPANLQLASDYGIRISSIATSDGNDFCNGNFSVITSVPANRTLQNMTLGNGTGNCFDASQIITIAGNGTTFNVQNGASASLIAGQKIQFLSGAKTFQGGYLHGYITTNSQYCNLVPPSTLPLGSMTITNGQNNCFNAAQSISTAGNGNIFAVQSGGNVHLIAGQVVHMYPTTVAVSSGNLHAYISTDGVFCSNPKSLINTSDEDNNNESEKGINLSSNKFFKVYPNPTTGNFLFEINGESPVDKIMVNVYGIMGEKILTATLTSEHKHAFSLSDRPSGVYFIRVITGDKSETLKIIKQ